MKNIAQRSVGSGETRTGSDSPRTALRPAPAGSAVEPLGTRALEERKLIHRNDSVRVQADAFRALRTKLLAHGGDTNFVTLVAPVNHGCGASFVARNLAAAFAFDETKAALLIDCDVLRPAQHRVLAIDANRGGLIDYLDAKVEDIATVQYETGLSRLRLIPSGSQREMTSEYFSSSRMRMMIDSLRASHPNCYIILDAPPALGSPDARILSDLADQVVVVSGYGRATVEDVDAAASAFDQHKLAGIVFNDRH